MRSLFLGLGLLLAVFLSSHRVEAQAIVLPCVPSGTSCIPVSAANPLPTTSAITDGTTTVTCSSGTTGVLFQSSGKVGCNQSFTTDGAGVVVVGASTRLQGVDGVSAIFSNASTGGMFFDENTASPAFTWRQSGFATVLDWNSTTASTWTFPSGTPVTMASATIKLTGITTGTNADFLCRAADGTVTLQTSACTISSARFKKDIWPVHDSESLSIIAKLEPVAFNMREGTAPNPDHNFAKRQLGLIAENAAAVDPRLAIYEDDGVTPKSYRQEAVIAALVGAVRDLKAEIDALKKRLP